METTIGVKQSSDRGQLARRIQGNIRPEEVQCFMGPGDPRRPKPAQAEMLAECLHSLAKDGFLSYRRGAGAPDGQLSPMPIIHRGFGDSGDLSIVAASLLAAIGNDAFVAVGTRNGSAWMWVAGQDEKGGFILETTGPAVIRVDSISGPSRGYKPEILVSRNQCFTI